MTPDYLYLNSRDFLLRLEIVYLVYFEADGNYTNIMMANKMKHTVGMTLAKTKEVLTDSLGEKVSMFARIGKSHIINLRYIHKLDIPRQTLVLSDGHSFAYKVTVSKEALRKLKDMLTMHKTRKES